MTGSVSLKQAALGDLEHEIATTRRLLERLPDEHLAWKPHPRSMSLGGLAWHVANILFWQKGILEQDGLDLGGVPARSPDPGSAAEVLRHFDENAAAVRSLFAALDDESLGREWTLRSGDHVILSAPRGRVMRGFGLSHMIHHRAQLSVYLRLLDVPLPSMYGPTADEQ